MSVFKDMVSKDLLIFLNEDEFAKKMRVEGKEITVVTDTDALKEMMLEHGLAESSLLLYAAVEDLPTRKAPGSVLNINGWEYTIDFWGENDGMASIMLSEPTM